MSCAAPEFWPGPFWRKVLRTDPAAREIADRHYSRQTIGAREWLPPGKVLALLAADHSALWGVCENLDPAGGQRWRVTMFRNEGQHLSSELIRQATEITFRYWDREYGIPSVKLTTEIDPKAVRAKRDPGRCFRKAGWIYVTRKRGLVVLEAPSHSELI